MKSFNWPWFFVGFTTVIAAAIAAGIVFVPLTLALNSDGPLPVSSIHAIVTKRVISKDLSNLESRFQNIHGRLLHNSAKLEFTFASNSPDEIRASLNSIREDLKTLSQAHDDILEKMRLA